MARAGDIAESVLLVVLDDSYDEDTVLVQLNKCISDLSRRFILPSLDSEGTVETVLLTSSVALPEDYQRNLYYCKPADPSATYSIDIYNSKDQLSRYLDTRLTRTSNRVIGVSAVRPLLYYAPIPTVETELVLRYQRIPDQIVSSTDLDPILPHGFENLWEVYALWKLYAMIEQGVEGRKVDTEYYMAMYLGLQEELRQSLTEGVSMPAPHVARMERW